MPCSRVWCEGLVTRSLLITVTAKGQEELCLHSQTLIPLTWLCLHFISSDCAGWITGVCLCVSRDRECENGCWLMYHLSAFVFSGPRLTSLWPLISQLPMVSVPVNTHTHIYECAHTLRNPHRDTQSALNAEGAFIQIYADGESSVL